MTKWIEKDMDKLEIIFKALADKNRLRILKLLEGRKVCVCELSFVLGITQPSISEHLKKLREAGLIAEKKDSFWKNYYLNKSDNLYTKKVLKILKLDLKEDIVYKNDLKKLAKADRRTLCCK